jgi:hypothetical protein
MRTSLKSASFSRGLLPLAIAAALAPAIGCIGGASSDTEGVDQRGNAVTGPGLGVDYSFARPTPASIVAGGYGFVARYLSNESGKNLSLSEADALIAAGLDVLVVWEDGANNSLDGFNQGVTDATTAESQATADGQPAGRPIYFAIDFDAQPSQQAAIEEYFAGVASVIGLARTGAYGGYGPISRLFNDGKITWGWQTYAWSGGEWDARAQLRQIDNGIAGGSEDEDQSMVDDFGQWGPGGAPPAPAGPTACTVGTVAGTCIATTACAAMAGYTSTAGHCTGAADIECCTPAATPPPPPAPTTCTAGGVAGTCIATTTCAAMAGYTSTPGLCAGAANVECCTLAATPPPPPPPATCTAGGVAGTCIDTSTCAAMAGYTSTPGLCAGAADVECCTLAAAPPPPVTCTAGGVEGTCIATSTCATMAGYTSTAGHCAGAADIECCTPPPSCTVNGTDGVCIATSTCAALGNTSTPGFCAGAANIECCTP